MTLIQSQLTELKTLTNEAEQDTIRIEGKLYSLDNLPKSLTCYEEPYLALDFKHKAIQQLPERICGHTIALHSLCSDNLEYLIPCEIYTNDLIIDTCDVELLRHLNVYNVNKVTLQYCYGNFMNYMPKVNQDGRIKNLHIRYCNNITTLPGFDIEESLVCESNSQLTEISPTLCVGANLTLDNNPLLREIPTSIQVQGGIYLS